MEGVVAALINLHPFPTGRRLFALEAVQKRAQELGVPVVAAHAQRGIAHDRTTLAMESAGQADQDDERHEAEARELDTQLHRAILGLDSYLDLQVRVFSADSARGHAATILRKVLLPLGAGAMLQLPVTEELAEVDALIRRLDLPEATDALGMLPDIMAIVERIKAISEEYRRNLNGHSRIIGPEELCGARIRGQRLLAETVALILSHFAVHAPSDDRGRNYLLEPILNQDKALAEARRRRRQPTDVDPATGLEENTLYSDPALVIDSPTLDLRRPAA